NRLYIHSHTAVFTLQNISAELEPFDPGPAGQRAASAAGAAGGPPPGPGPRRPAGGLGPQPGGLGPRPGALGPPGGRPPGTFLQGTIPLVKPPWDRITAYDMNSGDMLWQT